MKASRMLVVLVAVTVIVALAGSSPVWAAGADTNAGTQVDNSVLLSFDAGQALGNTASSTASFKVDRRVLFTNTNATASTVDVFPGDVGNVIEFDVVNDTNGTVDMLITLTLTSAPGVPPSLLSLVIDSDLDNACTATDVAAGTLVGAYLDEVAEDEIRTICLVLDAAGASVQADTYGYTIDAQAALGGVAGTLGAALINANPDAWEATTVQSNFGDGAGYSDAQYDGLFSAHGVFYVVNVNLIMSKSISGVSNTAPWVGPDKAIPGSTVSYRVVVDNQGNGDADNVSVLDTLSPNIEIGTDVINIVSSGATATSTTDNLAPASDTILWTINTLGSGSSVNLTYDVVIP